MQVVDIDIVNIVAAADIAEVVDSDSAANDRWGVDWSAPGWDVAALSLALGDMPHSLRGCRRDRSLRLDSGGAYYFRRGRADSEAALSHLSVCEKQLSRQEEAKGPYPFESRPQSGAGVGVYRCRLYSFFKTFLFRHCEGVSPKQSND